MCLSVLNQHVPRINKMIEKKIFVLKKKITSNKCWRLLIQGML